MKIFVFLLGSIIGSFLNVCIYRIPKEIGIVYPSSYCPKCSIPLKWYNLIPIISYLIQRGRCGNCDKIISPQYPIIEILNGILYLILYNKLGLTIDAIFYGSIFSVLLVISCIDLYHQIIPDSLNILILIIGFIYNTIKFILYGTNLEIINHALGLMIPGCMFLLIAIITKGNMGGGDIKLIGVLGFILGVKKVLLNIFLSFISGAIISIFLLLFKIKGRKDSIPFGPFICLSFIITLLWGDRILDWYIIINQRLYH